MSETTMGGNGAVKRLAYYERLQDTVWLDILGARDDMAIDRLPGTAPDDHNWNRLAAAHVYQVLSSRPELPPAFRVHDDLLARCPNLLMVSTQGAGYDTVDVAACTAAGVIVFNQSGANSQAVAEHALAMIMTLSKRIGEADRVTRRGPPLERATLIGHSVQGKTLGIIGLGRIGTALAHMCRAALDMRILAYDPYLTDQQFAERGAESVDFETLLRTADFVSINCPRTSETERMVGADALALMKPSAFLVTTARGGIHDETALIDALHGGGIAGAGIDVWDEEPPPGNHQLFGFDNVICSPHTAGVTVEARRQCAVMAAEQIITAFDGNPPPRLLNPEAWPLFQERQEQLIGSMPPPA